MSKRLDDELTEAIESHGAEVREYDPAPGLAGPAERKAPAKGPRNVALLVTLLVMVGAVVTLFLVGFKNAAIYATPVDQLVSSSGMLAGRKVRIEGELVPGSLLKRDDPCEYRFRVHGATTELPVRYARCAIPDGFRDVPSGGVQLTVEGAMNGEGTFEASLVMAKCASKYDPNTHTMQDDKGPPALPVN
jgi:cytochrome c-type biogenesis protein CcmE